MTGKPQDAGPTTRRAKEVGHVWPRCTCTNCGQAIPYQESHSCAGPMLSEPVLPLPYWTPNIPKERP